MHYNTEKYIHAIDVDKFRKCIANFRCASHTLMVERGRHYGIPKEYRRCPYCETSIEDEKHFVLVCPLYSELRKSYTCCHKSTYTRL